MLVTSSRERQSVGVHIPDGFLDARTCVGTYCLAGAGLAWAGRQVTARWNDRTVPLLGVMSAFVFAGQMVNFPVVGGTSGHLLGGVLAAALLGPWAAALALATVLVVQCLFFQDGGLTALGANVLNLALLGTGVGYLVLGTVRRLWPGRRGFLAALAIASWLSVVTAASSCALQLAASGTVPLRLVLPAMLVTHALIGVGEALITVAVVSFVLKVRPDLLYEPTRQDATSLPWGSLVAYGLALASGVGLLLAPLASVWPDGLERIAGELGFDTHARPVNPAPLADYTVPGIASSWWTTVAAAIIGVGLVFAVAWFFGRGAAWWARGTTRRHGGEP
jgi:cobalt/nickel transport system permease protein